MSLSQFIFRTIFLSFVFLSEIPAARPNVVFIITDDQSWDSLGFMGGEVHTWRKSVLQRNRVGGFKNRQAYALWLDDGAGTILDKVKELGLERDTQNVFGEMGHSRGIKTKIWKYIAVRYPAEVQRKIERGGKFKGFAGQEMDLPYLTRNGHLGHHASKVNPHYFEADQLYDLRKDPEKTENVFSANPEVAERMKRDLAKALKEFKERPFGEFAS